MDSNIGEILCEAVDTIVSKRLQDLNYNITQTCIIVDNTQKKIGKYSVRYDSLIFDAYSTDTTLKVNDKVSVLIPNGDYNEQKIILNKIIQNEDLTSSIAHISPLKQMLKFSNNIIDNKDKIIVDNTRDGEMSLLANGDNNISYLNPEKITYQLLYSIDFSSYNNFTKLGISADFQTWLKDLGAVTGDYGLEFLFFDDSSSLNDKDEKKSTYRFTFSTEDILGNGSYKFSQNSLRRLIDSFICSSEQAQLKRIYSGAPKDSQGITVNSFFSSNSSAKSFAVLPVLEMLHIT